MRPCNGASAFDRDTFITVTTGEGICLTMGALPMTMHPDNLFWRTTKDTAVFHLDTHNMIMAQIGFNGNLEAEF
jgi:hypothetical protein